MTPIQRTLDIRLDANPRYAGTIHDDQVARQQGYRAALVPGAFLYGHFSRLAVDLWGMEWIERGEISIRFRRAVYNGDAAVLTGTREDTPHGSTIHLSLVGQGGEIAATGTIGLPGDTAPAPPVDAEAIRPWTDVRPVFAAGTVTPGLRGGTENAVLSREEVRDSLRAFGEDHAIYRDGGLVHSGCLMRKAMFELNRSFALPGPYVLTACTGRHFAPMLAGQRFATVSVVERTFLRNARYYFVSAETVMANEKPVAQFVREQIYAIDQTGA